MNGFLRTVLKNIQVFEFVSTCTLYTKNSFELMKNLPILRKPCQKKADFGLSEKFSTCEIKQKERKKDINQKISFRNKEADSKVRGTAKVLLTREDIKFSNVYDLMTPNLKVRLLRPNSRLAAQLKNCNDQ